MIIKKDKIVTAGEAGLIKANSLSGETLDSLSGAAGEADLREATSLSGETLELEGEADRKERWK